MVSSMLAHELTNSAASRSSRVINVSKPVSIGDGTALAGVLDATEWGMLALNHRYVALASAERHRTGRAGRDAFSDALEQLDE